MIDLYVHCYWPETNQLIELVDLKQQQKTFIQKLSWLFILYLQWQNRKAKSGPAIPEKEKPLKLNPKKLKLKFLKAKISNKHFNSSQNKQTNKQPFLLETCEMKVT